MRLAARLGKLAGWQGTLPPIGEGREGRSALAPLNLAAWRRIPGDGMPCGAKRSDALWGWCAWGIVASGDRAPPHHGLTQGRRETMRFGSALAALGAQADLLRQG